MQIFSGRVFLGVQIFHSLYERLRYRNGIAHFGMGGRNKFGHKNLSARAGGEVYS